MLPKVVWNMPEYGTFNLHASLLPEYRGAAPINWAIINGEHKTGVTSFFIDDKIDTGEIILQRESTIKENETVGELHDTLMYLGAEVVLETVELIKNDTVTTYKQPESEEKTAYKLFSDTCKIDWNDSIENIYNKVRGLNPYPAAWTTIYTNEQEITAKIYKVEKEIIKHSDAFGEIITTKKSLKVAAKNGYLIIHEMKLSGKKKMDIQSLLNGFQFSVASKMA